MVPPDPVALVFSRTQVLDTSAHCAAKAPLFFFHSLRGNIQAEKRKGLSKAVEQASRRRGGTVGEAGKKAMAGFKLPEAALRLCVVPLAVVSLWEMATNRQADDTYGEVKFSNLSGFKYLVGINAIAAAYSVASILLSSFKSFPQYDWVIFLMDQAVAYLLVTSASAAAEVLQLARHGDREVAWSEVCSYFGRFCGKATLSLALHAAALACFVALALVSAFRVFSKCHPPGVSDSSDCSEEPKHAEEQGK